MPLSDTVLLLMALLAIGVLVRGVFIKLPVPYTVMLVVLGMVLGNLASVWGPLEPIRSFQLSSELVFFVFLPVLIFQSGLSLHARQLAKDIAPVLVLAIPALLLSTTIVGTGVWLLTPLDPTTSLLFGALISATDPVAVVSLFKELGTPTRLTTLVEGESLLNDATAIVLFTILLGLAMHGGFAAGDIGSAVLEFLKVFLGGALLGFVLGLSVSRLVIRLNPETSSVQTSSLILAYVAFIGAEHGLHFSGVMAVVSAAVSFTIFASPRLAEETGRALHKTWELMADISNTLLFLLIGITVSLQDLLAASGTILLVSVLVIAARGFSVYGFVPLAVKLFKLPTVTMGERHIMWWGGLKGGLAIAIVLSIPAELPGKELLLNLTLGVVLFSLLINAPTIRPLIEKLGLNRLSEYEEVELKQTALQAQTHANAVLQKFLDNRVLSKAGHYHAVNEITQDLDWPVHEVSEESRKRKQRLDTLREENRELELLFYAGVIPYYSFLDLKAETQRERDLVVNPRRVAEQKNKAQADLFVSFESALIRRLRESKWASYLLPRYQNRRISQHITMNLARILMVGAAIEYAQQQIKMDPRFDASILEHYQQKLRMLHDAIADLQLDFEQFYRRFETRFAKRAALISVLRYIQHEQRRGVIGSKVFVVLEQAITHALDMVSSIAEPLPSLKSEDLIRLVPLFSDFSDAALQEIAANAASVNFLPGDVVIAEGEQGDALYIIVKGRVRVSRNMAAGQQVLADLLVGDFFGEMALLGNHVRHATVTAHHACTLLRLRAQDVMEIAGHYPQIADYLSRLKQERERILNEGPGMSPNQQSTL